MTPDDAGLMSALKPCPLCGSSKVRPIPMGRGFYVQCGGCNLSSGAWSDFQYVVDRWNTRPREDALRSKLDQINGILKRADRPQVQRKNQ